MLPTLKTPGIWVCVYSHALSYQFINSWFKKKKKKNKTKQKQKQKNYRILGMTTYVIKDSKFQSD